MLNQSDFQRFLIEQAEKKDGRPFNQENIDLVMECLCYKGKKRGLLTDAQYVKAYLFCNGFGDIDLQFALAQDFDWSHVRDSSPIGFDQCANYLRGLGL